VQNAGTPARLEIRELQKKPNMLNIFLLGLARFHATPQEEKNSYYQLCCKCIILLLLFLLLLLLLFPLREIRNQSDTREREREREKKKKESALLTASHLSPPQPSTADPTEPGTTSDPRKATKKKATAHTYRTSYYPGIDP
jgi:flagellar biosynthesis/type III secretory pathway M-ring protein FliF/YscJ